VQRPNGTVFVTGGDANTGVYTRHHSWAAGPTFPVVSGHQLFVDGRPAALLQDGNVLCVASQSNYGKHRNSLSSTGKKLLPVPAFRTRLTTRATSFPHARTSERSDSS